MLMRYERICDVSELSSELIGLKARYLIGRTVESGGLINLGTDYEYIAAIGIGDAVNDNQTVHNLRVNKFWKNQYGIWYAEIYQDDELYTNTYTEINLFVLLATM